MDGLIVPSGEDEEAFAIEANGSHGAGMDGRFPDGFRVGRAPDQHLPVEAARNKPVPGNGPGEAGHRRGRSEVLAHLPGLGILVVRELHHAVEEPCRVIPAGGKDLREGLGSPGNRFVVLAPGEFAFVGRESSKASRRRTFTARRVPMT
jgi:hypothetical protein